jgi:hypothetical protein
VIRHCDGTDEFLTNQNGEPCACGAEFDDVHHRVVYPHEQIPMVKLTPEEIVRLAETLGLA